MPTSVSEINLTFRPKGYFWPMSLRTHVVSSIKGAERKAYVKEMFEEGREGELPPTVVQSGLPSELRQATGAMHPSLMGGEYLPDQHENEIEIARITIASTTSDVTSVYAGRNKDDIHYRTVDEYEGDTLCIQTTCSSKLPLTLGELADFFLGAWDLIGVLEMNFESNRYPADEVRSFFEASSEFYPDFGKLIEQRVETWLQKKLSEFTDEDETDEG
jgi:hypothetical protein